MKISVKTLKGNQFSLDVNPSDTVIAVKKQIEDLQGKDTFPCSQQLLIHQGKVLKDETTLEENKVAENGFLVVMLTKGKPTSATPSSTSGTSSAQSQAPSATVPAAPSPIPAAPVLSAAPVSTAADPPTADVMSNQMAGDMYGQAASNLVAGSNLQQIVQQILDMGGGSWDRDTVVHALHAAYNNPERAVDYLYNGIPESAEVAVPVIHDSATEAAGTAPVQAAPTGGPNAAPLNLFPQGIPAGLGAAAPGPGALDFLQTNSQFQALRAMVQANPQILQPMLQELGRQNPQLLRIINDNHGEFLRLINEPVAEGADGGVAGQLEGVMPQTISITPEEREAIDRLESMGFDRALVIEAYLACDKNEQMAANYLLEHSGEQD